MEIGLASGNLFTGDVINLGIPVELSVTAIFHGLRKLNEAGERPVALRISRGEYKIAADCLNAIAEHIRTIPLSECDEMQSGNWLLVGEPFNSTLKTEHRGS